MTFALFYFAKARFYYTMPLYPVLLAAGSVVFGDWVDRMRRAAGRNLCRGAQWAGLVFGGVAFALLVTPVAPFGSSIWNVTSKVARSVSRGDWLGRSGANRGRRIYDVSACGRTGKDRDTDGELWRGRAL